MKIIYHTTLFRIVPDVEFSFTPQGNTYLFHSRRFNKKANKHIVILRRKGKRKTTTRKFTDSELFTKPCYLKSYHSPLPKSSIAITHITL